MRIFTTGTLWFNSGKCLVFALKKLIRLRSISFMELTWIAKLKSWRKSRLRRLIYLLKSKVKFGCFFNFLLLGCYSAIIFLLYESFCIRKLKNYFILFKQAAATNWLRHFQISAACEGNLAMYINLLRASIQQFGMLADTDSWESTKVARCSRRSRIGWTHDRHRPLLL